MGKPRIAMIHRDAHRARSGAEGSFRRIANGLGEFAEVVPIHVGAMLAGKKVAGASGPGWWRQMTFARSAEAAVARLKPDLTLSFDRGPRCDLFRAGDGVHRVWLQIRRRQRGHPSLSPIHAVLPRLERRSVLSAKRVIANSAMVAGEMREHYGLPDDRLAVIPNGFDPAKFFPSSEGDKPEPLQPPGRHMVFLGNGWERKGLSEALRILAAAHEVAADARCTLHVLGSGKSSRYERLTRHLGISGHVRFHGRVSDVPRWLQHADALLLPTLYDPFTNAVLEALACGCPAITTVRNGAHEVLRPDATGFVIGDAERDREAAARFLLNPPGDRAAIADTVAHLTAEAEARAFARLVEEILAGKAARQDL